MHLILKEDLSENFLIAALRIHEAGGIKQPGTWQGETETPPVVWFI